METPYVPLHLDLALWDHLHSSYKAHMSSVKTCKIPSQINYWLKWGFFFFHIVSLAWIIFGHVYVIDWRGTLSRHNSHLMCNKRCNIQNAVRENGWWFLWIMKCKETHLEWGPKKSYLANTRAVNILNLLREKRVRRVPIPAHPRFVCMCQSHGPARICKC